MVFILYDNFNEKIRGVFLFLTQLENMNNKICLRKQYELNTHIKLMIYISDGSSHLFF